MLEHQTYDNREKTQSCCGCGGGSKSGNPVADATVTDPVCGMMVDPATSKHRLEHAGQTYFFCCGGCRTKFATAHAEFTTAKFE
jgi:Cu+-exporting ATPase